MEFWHHVSQLLLHKSLVGFCLIVLFLHSFLPNSIRPCWCKWPWNIQRDQQWGPEFIDFSQAEYQNIHNKLMFTYMLFSRFLDMKKLWWAFRKFSALSLSGAFPMFTFFWRAPSFLLYSPIFFFHEMHKTFCKSIVHPHISKLKNMYHSYTSWYMVNNARLETVQLVITYLDVQPAVSRHFCDF